MSVCVCVHIYMHATIINKKETMNLNENKERYMGSFGGRKEKKNVMKL